MLRRGFLKTGIASIVGIASVTTLSQKQGKFTTPTHTIGAQSKKDLASGINIPCTLVKDSQLRIGSSIKVKWDGEEELEDFVVVRIEDTRESQFERVPIGNVV